MSYFAFGTPLRSNYSFSQIRKDCWQYDEGFKSIHLQTPTLTEWSAILRIAGKTINLHSIDQEVFVEGVRLNFSDRLDLRGYIRKNFLPARPLAAFNGNGQPNY